MFILSLFPATNGCRRHVVGLSGLQRKFMEGTWCHQWLMANKTFRARWSNDILLKPGMSGAFINMLPTGEPHGSACSAHAPDMS